MSLLRTALNTVAEHPASVTPGAAVVGINFLGVPLEQWVYIVTIAYTLVNLGWLVWRIWEKYHGKDKPRE